MSAEDFEKNHAYNIRHSYGREGKKTDYTPHGCTTVMAKVPSTSNFHFDSLKIIFLINCILDEYHGCVFKHMDEINLRRFLEKYKISS